MMSARLLASASLLGIVLASPGQGAQPESPYFAGKTLSIYVGTAPGGTNDLIMRLVAAHIVKYLPGNPKAVPKNLPGGGGRTLAAYLYNQAPKDGTEFGVFQRAIVTDPLLVDPSLPFEMPKFNWIGNPTPTTETISVWHQSPVQSMQDMLSRELVLAGSAGNVPLISMVTNITGAKIKPILAYPGGAEINLALERREADGRIMSWEAAIASYPDWVKEKKIKAVIQVALRKHAHLQDVPIITDYAKSEQDKQALKVLLLPQEFGFPFMAPPGLRPEIVAALREAFDRTMADPVVLAEAKKLQLDLVPVKGTALQGVIAEVYGFPPNVIQRAKELMGEAK
jgi:tripartite-type tricarboxylate transporter receptor subunit TctC